MFKRTFLRIYLEVGFGATHSDTAELQWF